MRKFKIPIGNAIPLKVKKLIACEQRRLTRIHKQMLKIVCIQNYGIEKIRRTEASGENND